MTADHTTALAGLMADLASATPDGQDPSAGLAALAALADPDVLALVADAQSDPATDGTR